MIFNTLIASSIIAFVAAAPAPVDWKTVSYDFSNVDWNTVSYDFSNIDWKTVNYGVDWKTVNYGGQAAPTQAASTTKPASTPAQATSAPSASASSAASTGPYSFISTHSGDINVHLQPIYVNGTLKLGGSSPFSYTPSGVTGFPEVSVAQFDVGNNGMSLAVSAPGGQQMYVNADGTIGYTVPHSASTPSGSTTTGFTVSAGSSMSELKFDDKSQFVACPVTGQSGIYDVVVASKTSRTDCTGVGIVGSVSTSAPAYEWL